VRSLLTCQYSNLQNEFNNCKSLSQLDGNALNLLYQKQQTIFDWTLLIPPAIVVIVVSDMLYGLIMTTIWFGKHISLFYYKLLIKQLSGTVPFIGKLSGKNGSII